MSNQNTRKQQESKVAVHTAVLLMVLTLAAVSFAGGYYVAAMQAAGMITK